MSAQDIKAAAYAARDIDRAIEAGARDVERLLHRTLYPWTGTRRFDVPGTYADSLKVYFGKQLLISPTSVVADGVTTAPTDYFLYPDDGPPYRRLELDRSTSASWSTSVTPQQALAIAGLWGWTNDESPAATTAEALDASETGLDVGAAPLVGVGSVVRVDDERMIVTDRGWLTTGQTGSLAAQQNARTLAVSDGTAFAAGETLLLESERVLVVDVAGNNLTVQRSVDGSVLAAHTNATIYAPRLLTVQRGALGTTAASHLTASALSVWVPPSLAGELNLAYAVNTLLQRQSGYARTIGEGDNARESSGRGIRALEAAAKSAYGQNARTRAV
jgi:hypothetical protein